MDVIAIFMDALEGALLALGTEDRLVNMIESVATRNIEAQKDIDGLFLGLTDELKNVIISLGLVSGLDAEDEESINRVIDEYAKEIDGRLSALKTNSLSLKELICEMTTTPSNLVESAEDSESTDETDEFGFF
jgi:hypothetical protein